MTRTDTPNIVFIDDEPSVCNAVDKILSRLNYGVTCFHNAQQGLMHIQANNCDLLITDVNMPDIDGIELLKEIKKSQPSLPVLIVTGYADIPLAIRAIKNGAEDFIEKPLNRDILVPTVNKLLRNRRHNSPHVGYRLTLTEKKVLSCVMEGKSNREIARQLHRSVRTVEDHRARAMQKLGAKNLVELVKITTNMNLDKNE